MAPAGQLRLQPERLQAADAAAIAAMHATALAAGRADDPGGPPWPARHFAARLTLGPPAADPAEAWYVRDGDGDIAGWYWARFPERENRLFAELMLTVAPAARRRGLGSALARHAAGRAAARGRALLIGEIRHASAGEAFALAAGARHGIDYAERVIGQDAAAAASHPLAAGYALARWLGPTPAGLQAGLAVLHTTMNDAPMEEGEEPALWDAARVRLDDERAMADGRRRYIVAARCEATGELAGYTELRVHDDVPDWGFQGNTVVARAHRGHRLGLALKAAMARWLAAAQPAVRQVQTWNAASNAHMIAVNDQLGAVVRGTPACNAVLEVAALAP